MKCCTKCKTEKSQQEFSKNKNNKDGLSCWCKLCKKIWNDNNKGHNIIKKKEWDEKNKEHIKKYREKYCLNKYYNITLEEKKNFLLKQNNKCAICFKLLKESKDINIDHNHITNEIRGILCNNCNTGLGLFKDSIPILEQAFKYLKKYNK
jgi:hypothetical protein